MIFLPIAFLIGFLLANSLETWLIVALVWILPLALFGISGWGDSIWIGPIVSSALALSALGGALIRKNMTRLK